MTPILLMKSKNMLCFTFFLIISTLLIHVVAAISFIFSTAKYAILYKNS